MAILSIILSFVPIFICYRSVHSRYLSSFISLIIFISLFLNSFYHFANFLSGYGIDESVYYHLTTDLQGADFSQFTGIIIIAVICFIFVFLFSVFTYRKIQTSESNASIKPKITLAFLILTIAFYYNPAVSDLAKLYSLKTQDTDEVIKLPEFFIIDKEIAFKQKPNLVYLYLESFERGYFDETLFPGLVPNLKKLEPRSLNFTNIKEVTATNWTLAGMVASQCGIPLFTTGGQNSMSGMDTFLPGAVCLGDVLKNEGYDLTYIGGADLDFAGKGKFYKNHGFDMVQGLYEIIETLENKNYKNNWGLYDDTLLSLSKKRYQELSLRNKPFGLFILTLDTHGNGHGHLSKSCEDQVYKDGSNQILNNIHCVDKIASEFINDILTSESFANTLLVVSSDHLAHPNSATKKLRSKQRRNLLMIFNNQMQPEKIEKVGSTLDITPTILNFFGENNNRLGFGRDLIGDMKTLTEVHPDINRMLNQSSSYIHSLWKFPQIKGGIIIDTDTKKMRLKSQGQDRYISYPALLILDNQLNVKEVKFDFYSPEPLITKVSKLDFKQPFLWVDKCEKNSFMRKSIAMDNQGYCASFGALGTDAIHLIKLENNKSIKFEYLNSIFNQLNFSIGNYKKRDVLINNMKEYGTNNVIEKNLESILNQDVVIVSGAGDAYISKGSWGSSYIRNLNSNTQINLKRGLNLIALNKMGNPILLDRVDTCNTLNRQAFQDSDYFRKIMDDNSDLYDIFVIITHETAVCGNFNLGLLFSGSGLTQWKNIKFREPYIGMIMNDKEIIEYNGEKVIKLEIQ